MTAIPPSPIRTGPARPVLLALAALGSQLMLVMDDTIVNVALPHIQRDLEFTGGDLAWVVDMYMVVFGGLMLASGRVIDLLGRRRIVLAGLVGFGVSSLFAGLSQTPGQLVAARGTQGLFAAILGTAALALLLATFTEPAARSKVLSGWAAVTGISGVVGVTLGGIITDTVGWRWAFLINLPMGLLFVGLLLSSGPAVRETLDRRSLDLPGALTVTAGLVALVWAVIRTTHGSWSDPETLVGLATAGVLLVGFVVQESRTKAPLLQLSAFRDRTYSVAMASIAVASAALFAMFFFGTQYMQFVQGWSPLRTGLSWTAFGLTFALSTGVAMKLMPVLGGRNLVLAGALLGAGGQLLWLRTTVGGSYVAQELPALVATGVGMGLCMIPLMVAALGSAPQHSAGTESGLAGTMQQVGGALGVAGLSTIAVRHGTDVLARTGDMAGAMTAGFHRSFLIGAGLLVLLALLALLLPPLREEVDTEALTAG
ncbi:MAG: MFS transporter [Austwickia sp.]|nr:MAG: MFS transporter [Austwickia sp.]